MWVVLKSYEVIANNSFPKFEIRGDTNYVPSVVFFSIKVINVICKHE